MEALPFNQQLVDLLIYSRPLPGWWLLGFVLGIVDSEWIRVAVSTLDNTDSVLYLMFH